MSDIDPRLKNALRSQAVLGRWLEFVGGKEFLALQPVLDGMRLGDLLQVDCSGLARLGAPPRVAVHLFEELGKLRNVLQKGARSPPWLIPLLTSAPGAGEVQQKQSPRVSRLRQASRERPQSARAHSKPSPRRALKMPNGGPSCRRPQSARPSYRPISAPPVVPSSTGSPMPPPRPLSARPVPALRPFGMVSVPVRPQSVRTADRRAAGLSPRQGLHSAPPQGALHARPFSNGPSFGGRLRPGSPRQVTPSRTRGTLPPVHLAGPAGTLPLANLPANERPPFLLGDVLRREAAIAAFKAAVQEEAGEGSSRWQIPFDPAQLTLSRVGRGN